MMEKLEKHRRGGEEENGKRRARGRGEKAKPNNEDKEQRRGWRAVSGPLGFFIFWGSGGGEERGANGHVLCDCALI